LRASRRFLLVLAAAAFVDGGDILLLGLVRRDPRDDLPINNHTHTHVLDLNKCETAERCCIIVAVPRRCLQTKKRLSVSPSSLLCPEKVFANY